MKVNCIQCNNDLFIFKLNIDKDTIVCKKCIKDNEKAIINWNLPREGNYYDRNFYKNNDENN